VALVGRLTGLTAANLVDPASHPLLTRLLAERLS
jgi:hypothetical protein